MCIMHKSDWLNGRKLQKYKQLSPRIEDEICQLLYW